MAVRITKSAMETSPYFQSMDISFIRVQPRVYQRFLVARAAPSGKLLNSAHMMEE
jgi:hypothetical protein